MADILLRERVSVLQCTLDAVAKVIDVLEHSRQRADARPTVQSGMMEALCQIQSNLGILRSATESAQFAPGAKPKFLGALATAEAYVQDLGSQLQAPLMTSRVSVRLDQLVGSLSGAVSTRRTELGGLEAALNAPGGLPDANTRARAWEKCLQIEADCSRLFADYLDLVRGVALRDSGLDDDLCRVADALVHELQPFGSITWQSLTVPASRERYDSPVASFVRIGFPEWSIWTVPLAAVEFASFLISQHKDFISLRDQTVDKLCDDSAQTVLVLGEPMLASIIDRAELPADEEMRAKLVRSAFERLTGMLLVEALATAVIGPAYAWSALLMRVHPYQEHKLLERLRRDAVIGTLDGLRTPADECARRDVLRDEWDALLASAGGSPGEISPVLAEVTQLVVQGVLDRVPFRLYESDWQLITQLADFLTKSAGSAEKTGARVDGNAVLGEITERYFRPHLRHVLNAGWVARLARADVDPARQAEPQGPTKLSRAVHEVCIALLNTAAGASAGTPARSPQTNLNLTLLQAKS